MFSALGPTASKTVIASHGLLFSRNAGKPYTDQSILLVFLTPSEKKTHTNLQKQKLQKTFSLVCMLLV